MCIRECRNIIGPKKYNGILITKLGQELHGEITVNLDGANQDLIQINTSQKQRDKRNHHHLCKFQYGHNQAYYY